MNRTHITEQQLELLAVSFLPTMRKFFRSEEGKALYQHYLDEKAENEKDDTDNKAV